MLIIINFASLNLSSLYSIHILSIAHFQLNQGVLNSHCAQLFPNKFEVDPIEFIIMK